ncbi:hypothetical protein [Hydrogenophaga sp.]|uniref:hypothetical protein n=1 Tax=Hydrogenophaga sp. TaxID=1904254 RepID=UPI0025BABCB4|nr:hypothetical protein [Hydrogenophaga sp.]
MLRRHAVAACALALLPAMARPQDQSARAERALTELLFTEEADEFTAYRFVNSRGYVEVIFASNIPRDLAKDLMAKIKALPEVSGARESFVGTPCRRF